MSAPSTESKGKARRVLAEQARRLASEGKWQEAIEVNQQIVERHPKDVDAHNRLGKAYYELARYRSAFAAYQTASTLDPANMIAQRNMGRIEPLRETEAEDGNARSSRVIPHGVFIEEVGKTYVDDIVNPASLTVLDDLASGDRLEMRVDDNMVSLLDGQGRVIGQLEPRISKRLIELTELGNQYEVYVISGSGQSVRVIIRETLKIAAMGNRLSFPRQGKVALPRPYLRDARVLLSEPDMLLGDDEDDEGDTDEADEFEAAEGEEEESDYVEEAGAPVDEDEETAI